MKLPRIELGPRPRPWDFAAIALVALSGAIAAFTWITAQSKAPGVPFPGSVTLTVALAQLVVLTASLLVLGKTAKEGTLWGNLAAVAGMSAGLGGILLAAAMWAAA